LRLFAKENGEDYGKDDADKDRGDDGEVEDEVVAF
jgi:hypothetical protein